MAAKQESAGSEGVSHLGTLGEELLRQTEKTGNQICYRSYFQILFAFRWVFVFIFVLLVLML